MSKLSTLTPIAALLAVSVSGATHAAENPFALKPAVGVVLADAHAGKEGKCGEGKCGEGKCGADKAADAKAPAAVAEAGKGGKEGKCGEGKCGGMKPADAAKPAAPQQ